MFSKAPIITNAGRSLQVRALGGELITFTRFAIGDGVLGEGENPRELVDLISTKLEFGITDVDTTQDGFIGINGSFDNTDIEGTYKSTELGIFCKGEDDVEELYAYINDGEQAGTLTDSLDVAFEQRISVLVAIGDAENVTAIISQSALYASKPEFDAHVANTNNPHEVTAEQVGLGNVPNVATNNQTPTYTETGSLQNLISGETLATAFAKIAKAVKDLILHISNKQNPHEVTAAQVGARPDTWTPTKSDVGLGNVGNFKAVSTVASQGLTDTEKSNARANIGAGTSSFSGSYNDLSNKPTIPTDTNQLTNEAGFITASATITGNAANVTGTVAVGHGGTGATTLASGQALIGNGTGAITTRAITNNSANTFINANSTNIPTCQTIMYDRRAALNRTTQVNVADTNYATYMARGEALFSSDTNPTANGCISWTYA